MSYFTSVTGSIGITPPITWGELREAGQNLDAKVPGTVDYGQVRLRVDEREVETDEGVLTVREGTTIIPWNEDAYRADPTAMQDVVRRFIGAFCSPQTQGLDDAMVFRQWSGYLEGEGEEQGDVWRLWVDNDGVHVTRAQLVWPAGVPGPGR